MKKNKQEYNVERLNEIEYLATNLVQKLREMKPYQDDFAATASGFGVEYEGPSCLEELGELIEALKK
jgi:hypothetical protein